jgi:hypothetical protein
MQSIVKYPICPCSYAELTAAVHVAWHSEVLAASVKIGQSGWEFQSCLPRLQLAARTWALDTAGCCVYSWVFPPCGYRHFGQHFRATFCPSSGLKWVRYVCVFGHAAVVPIDPLGYQTCWDSEGHHTHFDLEDGGNMFFWLIGKASHVHKFAWRTSRFTTNKEPLWKSQISYQILYAKNNAREDMAQCYFLS